MAHRRQAWAESGQQLPGIDNSPSVRFASSSRSGGRALSGPGASRSSTGRRRGGLPHAQRSRRRGGGGSRGSTGFDASTKITERGIPQYDAAADRNCPYTRSRKFTRHRKRMARAEAVDARNKHRMVSAFDQGSPAGTQRRRARGHTSGGRRTSTGHGSTGGRHPEFSHTTPARMGMGQSRGTTADTWRGGSPAVRTGPLSDQRGSVATPSGGITFSRVQSADPAQEMEVLKTILLREGYLQRIRQMTDQTNFAVTSELVDLLDLLRLCTVEVVESIMKWRRGLVRVAHCLYRDVVVVFMVCVMLRRRSSAPCLADVVLPVHSCPVLSCPVPVPVSTSHTPWRTHGTRSLVPHRLCGMA